jgi:hypothetical protein
MSTPIPLSDFAPFQKIARLSRDLIVTEKIDGTNAAVVVWDAAANDPSEPMRAIGLPPASFPILGEVEGRFVAAQSRNRFLTLNEDHYGLAAWVKEHVNELVNLGHGRHFGEWWGRGINRGYAQQERHFSLFNVSKWNPVLFDHFQAKAKQDGPRLTAPGLPECCLAVPMLYFGSFCMGEIEDALVRLDQNGSYAAPGFRNAEGVVVFHTASGYLFKKTILNDQQPKSCN